MYVYDKYRGGTMDPCQRETNDSRAFLQAVPACVRTPFVYLSLRLRHRDVVTQARTHALTHAARTYARTNRA